MSFLDNVDVQKIVEVSCHLGCLICENYLQYPRVQFWFGMGLVRGSTCKENIGLRVANLGFRWDAN